ncbi:MAG: carotenoid oxygenase family protein [Thermodesulfobacteriota bacterium]
MSVVYQGGRLLSSGEIGAAVEIDPSDLSTRGVFDFGGRVANSFTAHALRLGRGPIAEVELPRRVPFGFHGWWVPGDHVA